MNCEHPGFAVVTVQQYKSSIEAEKCRLTELKSKFGQEIVDKFTAIIQYQDAKFYKHWWNRLFNRIPSPFDAKDRAIRMLDQYTNDYDDLGFGGGLFEPFFTAAHEIYPRFYTIQEGINICKHALKPLCDLSSDTILHVTMDDIRGFRVMTRYR